MREISLKSITIAFGCAMIIIALFFRYIVLLSMGDYDEYWHLWVGRLISETGTVPAQDPISFITSSLKWININWLAQWISYQAFLSNGLGGNFTIAAWLAALVLVFHLAQLEERRATLLPSLISIGFLLYGLSYTFGARPQLYSFCFLAIFCGLLFHSDSEDRLSPVRASLLFVLLAIWNQMHGGVLFGYALLCCDIAASLLQYIRQRFANGVERISFPHRAIQLMIVTLGGMATFFFHPHGYDALLHILFYGQRMDPLFFQTILELQPYEIVSYEMIFLMVFVSACAIAIIRKKTAISFREILVITFFLLSVLSMRRMTTPFFIVVSPIAAALWTRSFSQETPPVENDPTARFMFRWTAGLLFTGLMYWTFVVLPQRTPPGSPGATTSLLTPPQLFPTELANFLLEKSPQGRIFNEYHLGGYLGWVLYPQRRIFIDGRGDLFSGNEVYEDYLNIINLKDDWLEKLSFYEIELVAMAKSQPLIAVLKDREGWIALYEDERFSLLRRPHHK